ncbi:hypothetical protein Glove_692g22 [Diversispora epigaea]|uniref:TLDc domain-containing protein n=1 Tax=Diversispora epigaea TaxID=1348612 RepID=A0A397G4T1_9GLOM|nr:hypothetical protein Glove_692g22 [Diversispora epigaea]
MPILINAKTLLIDTKAPWLKTCFSLIYRTIFNENNFKNLENYFYDIIAKYPGLIFDKCSKEKFLTLKITLQQCLPLIRYFHISNTEILDKIIPYKKILDKQLWKDIIQHLGAPERPVKSNILLARSVLVKELPPQHAAEISSWIDRKIFNYSSTNIPYKFELILNGTRDGFNPQTFWNICHGYDPLAWENTYNFLKNTDIPFIPDGKFMETKDCFIFSLKMQSKKYPSKHRQNNCGPRFGNFYLRSDEFNFTVDNRNCCKINDGYYEKLIRTSSSNYFSIVNYEVFKIIRKS